MHDSDEVVVHTYRLAFPGSRATESVSAVQSIKTYICCLMLWSLWSRCDHREWPSFAS